MKRQFTLAIILMIITSSSIWSQKITLKDCYAKALERTSLASEKEKQSSIWELKDKSLLTGRYPTVDANATAIYNSEVIDLGSSLGSLPIPGISSAIKPLPHDQYKITIDINQVIYDGGTIKNARALEEAGLDVNNSQTDVELYKIRSQVNTYYFGILMLDRQNELLESYLAVINKHLQTMQSALSNGMIIRSDMDVLTSEKLKIEQQQAEAAIRMKSLLDILSDVTGTSISSSKDLNIPSVSQKPGYDINRPELQLFDMRKKQLEAGLSMIESRRLPKAFGFATLGYGNPPANNFFRDEFAPYYIVGAGIKWNILDWNKARSEKKQIHLQQELLDGKKNDITDNLKRALQSKAAEIESLQSLIERDRELIDIRKRITSSAESQYKNGTITATDYLNELNAEQQALINNEIHKLSLVMASIEYLNISGKELE